MQMKTEQKTKLSVRPQMIQSAQLLQLSATELQQYLEELSLENPLMEFLSPAVPHVQKQEPPRNKDEQNRIYERQERENTQDPWNIISDTSESLTDALLFQMRGLSLKSRHRKILEHLIYSLDPNGYLATPLPDIQAAFGCTEETLIWLLHLLQDMEPWGVGARNLSECLCIQLYHLYPSEETALKIAHNELELLGKNQLPALAKKLKRPMEEIRHACELIRSLNPRPGAAYGSGRTMQYVYPELIVFQQRDSGRIALNEYHCPTIKANDAYMALFQNCDSPETQAYLTQKKEQLEWVQQCILQRNQTLLALGNLIFEVQQDFFTNGPGHLKPFTQASAAKILNVHESTVSRAIRDKYLQCIWGTFPLQHFFPQGMEHRDSICSRIRQLILEEDKFHPLSDQAISDILTREDLAISKRMVSKYRTELKIPEASVRRKY